MPRRELPFRDWLREARRIVDEQGPTALRDNIGEHLDEGQAKDTVVQLVVYIHSYETMRDVLRDDPGSGNVGEDQ
jgi:hypothetical protein